MKNKKSASKILRQKAEEKHKKQQSKTKAAPSEEATLKLIHELEVHEIELQMQQEELILAKERTELISEKYTELYDFAPSGYLSLSKKGEIIELNFCAAKMLGKERSLLMKSSFGLFISLETRPAFSSFFDKVTTSNVKETCEVEMEIAGNSKLYVQIEGTSSNNREKCLLTLVDISEIKLAQESIKNSLVEKEMLLKEIHHRVKNNLQIIWGLLDLQGGETENDEIKSALNEGKGRISTMALIHENLYQGQDLANIDLGIYLGKLLESVRSINLERGAKIELKNDIQDIRLGLDTITPLALIINELVTNSFKHGFRGLKKGLIKID